MKRLLIAVFIGMFLMCFTPAQADTQGIKLIWEKDVEADLAGFRVYMGTVTITPCPNIPLQVVDLPYTGQTSFSTDYQVTGAPLEMFYFRVTAYDTSGNESACSNEATYQLPPDVTPPAAPFNLTIEVVVIP